MNVFATFDQLNAFLLNNILMYFFNLTPNPLNVKCQGLHIKAYHKNIINVDCVTIQLCRKNKLK